MPKKSRPTTSSLTAGSFPATWQCASVTPLFREPQPFGKRRKRGHVALLALEDERIVALVARHNVEMHVVNGLARDLAVVLGDVEPLARKRGLSSGVSRRPSVCALGITRVCPFENGLMSRYARTTSSS